VLATVPFADAISNVVGGAGRDGEVVLVGVPGALFETDARHFVRTCGAVSGWASRHAKDWGGTLEFSTLRNVTPEMERFDLTDAGAAFDRTTASEARFRVVFEPWPTLCS
jgi:NADPH2:quinone reductase